MSGTFGEVIGGDTSDTPVNEVLILVEFHAMLLTENETAPLRRLTFITGQGVLWF